MESIYHFACWCNAAHTDHVSLLAFLSRSQPSLTLEAVCATLKLPQKNVRKNDYMSGYVFNYQRISHHVNGNGKFCPWNKSDVLKKNNFFLHDFSSERDISDNESTCGTLPTIVRRFTGKAARTHLPSWRSRLDGGSEWYQDQQSSAYLDSNPGTGSDSLLNSHILYIASVYFSKLKRLSRMTGSCCFLEREKSILRILSNVFTAETEVFWIPELHGWSWV